MKVFAPCLFLCFLLLWGCRKDVEEFRLYDDSLDDIARLLEGVPQASPPQTFGFTGATNDTILETTGGIRLFLADTEALFADSTGKVVPFSSCPNLRIQVRFITDRSDLIAGELNTLDPEGLLLESYGIVDIQATCDGTPLKLLAGRTIKVQIPSNDPLVGGLTSYAGVTSKNGFEHWATNNSDVFWADWQRNDGSLQLGYEFVTGDLGLHMLAQPFDEPLTSFCVTLPDNCNPENSVVYVLTQNETALAPLTASPGSNTFCFDKAPVGYPVKILTISKIETQFLMGYKQTEIGTNADVALSPESSSMNALTDFIKSL